MVNSKDTESCPVCGTKRDAATAASPRPCLYCGKAAERSNTCPEGHTVCDACLGSEPAPVIKAMAFTTMEKDPLAIAELMMGHPNLRMLSCEHAFIACGSLMAALKNSPYGGTQITNSAVREVFRRTEQQLSEGSCGLNGVCGIVPAIGACFSLFLGSRCGSDTEQRIAMDAVVKVSRSLADLTGPSCCKAYVRAGLLTAVEVFAERFGIVLPVNGGTIVCRHSDRHPYECREEKCPYFRTPTKDIFAGQGFVPGTLCTT